MDLPSSVDYQLGDYSEMIADKLRMDAYLQALRRYINPDTIVIDLGAGYGMLAIYAAKLGAKKVFAIEANGSINLAKRIAEQNHCSDQIEFIQALSQDVELEQPADLLISDLRGKLPLFGQHIPVLIDARKRLLKPSGILLPQQDQLSVAVACAPELYTRVTNPWGESSYSVNLGAVEELCCNSWTAQSIETNSIVSSEELWAEIDYRSIELPNVNNEVSCRIHSDCLAHGFFVWFDATIAEGISFSCGPGAENKIYGSVFFPWREPVELTAGQVVNISLHANLVGENYLWRWITSFASGKQFDQSPFYTNIFDKQSLQKRAHCFTPELNELGEIHQRILSLMNRRNTLEQIAAILYAEFPVRFCDQAKALAFIGNLSEQFSR